MKYRTQYLSGLFMFLFLVMVTSSQANAQDSLVAFYPFNGNATDQSGNGNHGIVNGATLSEDRFGNENSAYGFDGVDDYLVINDDDLLTPVNQKMTISLWFKTKFPGDRFILYKGSSQYNREYAMGVRTDSLASFQINHQGDWLARSSVQSTAIIEEEVWYHLVGIWNGNKLKIYINSKLENVVDTNLVIGNYDSDLYIGTYGGSISQPMNQYAFKGSIDDVRIYNYALDTLAVQDLYTEGGWPLPEDTTGIPKDTLVAHYPFSGTAVDSSGFENHGTVYGADLTSDRFGNPNSAYSFDGIDDFIHTNTSFDYQYRTVSVWIKTNFSDSTGSNYQSILNQDSHELTYGAFSFALDDGAIRFREGKSDGKWYFGVEEDRWYHLSMVRKDSIVYGYVNGELVGTGTAENTGSASHPSEEMLIGTTRLLDRYFDGSIDDIRIYNYALDSLAIHDLYTEGGWPLPEVDLPDTLVAHYPFSGNAEDKSGFENNGIVYGAKLTFDRFGNPNSAYNFDGIDDFIEIPHNPLFNSEVKTIQFWFKKNYTISDTPGLVDMEGILWKAFDTGLNRAFSFSIATEEPPFTFYLKIGNSTDSLLTAITEDAIINSRWYHAAGVITKDWISIYIDGVLVDSVSNDGQIINNTAPIVIAKASAFSLNTRYFEGVIDDIQIHNYALNSSRIWELYTEGGWPLPEDSTIIPNDTLAAYYPFNGNAEDSSGYGNHGEVIGASLDEDRFGYPNRAYTFDGIDDYIFIDNPQALHSAKNLSVSLWAKGTAADTSFAGLISSPNMQPFGVSIDDGDRILFSVSSESVPLNLVADNQNTHPEEWYQYVAVYRANEYLKLFKNGELAAALYGSIPSFMDVDSTGVYIGSLPVTYHGTEETFYFSGSIDDIRFYNHALSSESIQHLYQIEKASPVGIETEFQLPEKFQLYQNYPNPFNPTTNIKFDLPEAGIMSLKIYDMTGRLIATLINEIKSAGSHQVTFDASQIASGVYLYELKASGYSNVKKFTLIK